MHVEVKTVDGGNVLTTAASDTLRFYVDPTADAATVSASDVRGDAGSAIDLTISALLEVNATESMQITLSNVKGSLSAGIDNGNGTWTLTQAQLSDLKITPTTAENFTVGVKVVTTETDGSTATVERTFTVSAGDETLSGTTGIDTLYGYSGDDIITYTSGDTINGGDGIDTLLLGEGKMTLDFDKISSIEVIDLQSGVDKTLHVNLNDLVSDTDANTLVIEGHVTDDDWTRSEGTGAQEDFDVISNGTLTMLVDKDIQISGFDDITPPQG